MGERFESGRATVITRNKALAIAGASPLLLTVASVFAGALVSPRFYGATILSFILGSLLSGLVFLLNPFPKRDASGVTADPRGLATRAGAWMARESLREGMVVPGPHGHASVRLWRKGLLLPVEVAVQSEAEGVALLEALRLDPMHSVASFFGMSRVYATSGAFFANTTLFFLGPLLLGAGASSLHVPALGVAALLVGVLAYVSFFMPMRLQIGQDGLIVSWYGKKRLIPYADVEGAAESDGAFALSSIRGVVIQLRSGEQVMVPLSYGLWGRGRGAIAAERIREAMEAYARGEGAEADTLARGERTPSEWVLALRQIGAGANAGPRTAAMATDTLWRVVESAGSRPSVRAAAAVALASGLDEAERARLRSIAQGATAPKLRIALETASIAEDDAAIAEALGELEAEERAQMRERPTG